MVRILEIKYNTLDLVASKNEARKWCNSFYGFLSSPHGMGHFN
jgi:hypothetical protein